MLCCPFCTIRILPMPVPIARPVSLPSEEHARLESLVRAHSTPQALAFRCRLILRTAAPDRPSNLQVATEMACERHTVGRLRQRYLAHGLRGSSPAAPRGAVCRGQPETRPRLFPPPLGGVLTTWSRRSCSIGCSL